MNSFLKAVASHDTYTENGAVSHSTTGVALLDYFAKCGTYRDRTQNEVDADISACWAESPMITMQILMYLRNVTRQTHGLSEKVTKGQGARDEFRKAMVWVAKNHPDVFTKNMWLIPHVGIWKDFWHEDLHKHVPQNKLMELIKDGLENDYHRPLLAKYLPKIRSASNTHNDEHRRKNALARRVCQHLGWSEKNYRKFKASGETHGFQRAMSSQRWNDIDFSRIPGKALSVISSHKGRDNKTFLERHGLEKRYMGWLIKQPVARFTGYPYELLASARKSSYGYSICISSLSMIQKTTIDKQFDGLLELAKKDQGGLKGNVWCALDTSGSMTIEVVKGVSAIDICVSLGIYFSSLNEGAFKDHVIMFDSISRVKKLSGTFTDKVNQINKDGWTMGSTNFQSVIDEIVRIRKKNPNIPLSDYPETLLVVSDMQFNPAGDYYTRSDPSKGVTRTNYEQAMNKLKEVGLGDITVIWWYVTGRGKDFPSKLDDPGTVLISGFDGSVVTNILGGETETIDKDTGKKRKLNAAENMLKALNQDVFNLVQI